jgi:hypothetical protein
MIEKKEIDHNAKEENIQYDGAYPAGLPDRIAYPGFPPGPQRRTAVNHGLA